MSKVKYDGWCPKFFHNRNRPWLGTWLFFKTRRELLSFYENRHPGWWEKARKYGAVKAVKVRIVEVEE